jgi:hypothetical protein
MRRPLIREKQVAVVLGLAAFGAGWALLYDAWEGRGGQTPRWFRWATWW